MLLNFSSKHLNFTFSGFQAALLFIVRAVFLCLALFIFFVSTVSLYAQTISSATLYFLNPPATAISGQYTIQARATADTNRLVLQFDQIPGEKYEMSYVGDSIYEFNWDTSGLVNGIYNARLYAQISSGETIFAQPVSISVYNNRVFSFEIVEPKEMENQEGQIFTQVKIEPEPEYVQVEVRQNNLFIEKINLSPSRTETGIYSATWLPPSGIEGNLILNFLAARTGFENAVGRREVIYIQPNHVEPVVASTTLQSFHFYFQSPLPQAVIESDNTILFSSNLTLDYLNLFITGPTQSEILLDTSLAEYKYDWKIENYPEGVYVLRAEARSGTQSQVAELKVTLQRPLNNITDISTSTPFETDSTTNNYYLELVSDESIISGNKKFIVVSNIPNPVITAHISGLKNEEIRLQKDTLPEHYYFWWNIDNYLEGDYRIQVETEYENTAYTDYINVNYSKESFEDSSQETEAKPYELNFGKIPSAPVSGVVELEILSNYDLDKVQLEINNKKFDARRIDDSRYSYKWDTTELSNGNYTVKAGGILNGIVKSDTHFSTIVKNIINQAESEEISDSKSEETDVNATEIEDVSAKTFPTEPPSSSETDRIDSKCLAQGIKQEAVCQQFLQLEPECQVAGKITLIECRQYLNLNPLCRDLDLDTYQCRIFLQLPQKCQAENIISEARCQQFIFNQALSPECKEKNILNQKACEEYMARESTPVDASAETSDNENPECQEAGLEGEKCNLYLREKYLTKECSDLKITSLSKCNQTLLSIYSGMKCKEAGISDEEECHSYLVNKFSQVVRCEELGQTECRQLIKERYLGELIVKDRLNDVFSAKTINIKDSLSVADLSQGDEDLARAIPIKNSSKKIRVLGAQSDTVIDKNKNLQQSAPIALAYDEDNDGLIDSVEERLGTNPSMADTDQDGYDDGAEILNGFNPLGPGKLRKDFLSPVDEALLYKRLLGQPKTSGKIDAGLQIGQIENVINEEDEESVGYMVSGQAEANSVLTVYVYSDLPVVATVKSDEFGNWQYELGDLLSEGEHEIYVAVNDNTGKVIKKSSPISFFIKEARAVSIDDFVATSVVTAQTEAESMINIYVMAAIIIISVSLLLFFILFVILKNRQA